MRYRAGSIRFVLAICGVLPACHRESAARSERNLALPLKTGFEAQLSAPLGPRGELVAFTAAAWDSGWKALALPGTPPVVDFSKNVATLRAQNFAGSPAEYESGVDSVLSEDAGTLIAVYGHERMSSGGMDTSSRKVLATAIRGPVNQSPRLTVQWRMTTR